MPGVLPDGPGVRRLPTQFDDPTSSGRVATPTCCGAPGCCSCCCCAGTLLTASTVSAMRLHDAAAARGRRLPARLVVALAGALLFPVLVPVGIAVHNAQVSEQLLLLLPVGALAGLLVLWPLAGARGTAALLPPLVITVLAAAVFVLEVVVAGFLLLSGLWPVYLFVLLGMPVGAAFLERSHRARS